VFCQEILANPDKSGKKRLRPSEKGFRQQPVKLLPPVQGARAEANNQLIMTPFNSHFHYTDLFPKSISISTTSPTLSDKRSLSLSEAMISNLDSG